MMASICCCGAGSSSMKPESVCGLIRSISKVPLYDHIV